MRSVSAQLASELQWHKPRYLVQILLHWFISERECVKKKNAKQVVKWAGLSTSRLIGIKDYINIQKPLFLFLLLRVFFPFRSNFKINKISTVFNTIMHCASSPRWLSGLALQKVPSSSFPPLILLIFILAARHADMRVHQLRRETHSLFSRRIV